MTDFEGCISRRIELPEKIGEKSWLLGELKGRETEVATKSTIELQREKRIELNQNRQACSFVIEKRSVNL